ncbi:hemin-degrading factor [Rhodovibrionaceae bacterium A322]
MTESFEAPNHPQPDLLLRYKALRDSEPRLFASDAATKLGVSEAELIASRCGGDGATRLEPRWENLLKAMPAIGRVMCLTRNASAVHERKGVFEKIHLGEKGGIVLGADIDLRIDFTKWASAFALCDQTERGERKSLQFFDKNGVAVHKIYRQDDSDHQAWEALVADYRSDDQSSFLEVTPLGEPESFHRGEVEDEEVDLVSLRSAWEGMTDVHQFFGILRKHKVSRVQALRLIGPKFAEKVDNGAFEKALNLTAERDLPIMVFTGNPGMIQIHTGAVKELKQFGDWYNVLDPDFHFHLRTGDIVESWVVKKPTKDGFVTSLEIFDEQGKQIAWMFGQRTEGKTERADWRQVAESLTKNTQAVS